MANNQYPDRDRSPDALPNQLSAVFQVSGAELVDGMFTDAAILASTDYGTELPLAARHEGFRATVTKRAYTSGPGPAEVYTIGLTEANPGISRRIEAWLGRDGAIFQLSDERSVKATLGNGEQVALWSGRVVNGKNPESGAGAPVLTPEDALRFGLSQHVSIKITNPKTGAYDYIYADRQGIMVEKHGPTPTDGSLETFQTYPAGEDGAVFFMEGGRLHLGDADPSLDALVNR